MSWLYRYEAKGIQKYVLATDRLREAAGASTLVEQLENDVRKLLPLGTSTVEMKSAAAGQATLVFHDRQPLESFAAIWPLFVARTRPGLTLVQAWAEIGAAGEDAARKLVQERLEAARNAPSPELPEAGPLVARAARTGRAAIVPAEPGGRLHAEATWRRQDGAYDRVTWAKETVVADNEGRQRVLDVLKDRLLPDKPSRNFTIEATDFGEGYVGVLHADGNGIGRYLQEAQLSLEEYRRFSDGLKKVTELAARAATDFIEGRVARDPLPMRPVVVGGDDFTAVVAADQVIEFTGVFLSEFEKGAKRHLAQFRSGQFTACAGIALVKVGFPYYRAYDLAADLCGACKGSLRGQDGQHGGASGLLFHRVTGAKLESWADIRQIELGTSEQPDLLVGGPWWVMGGGQRALDGLLALTRHTALLPRGAIREWLRLLLIEPRSSQAGSRAHRHWTRWREVVKGRSPRLLHDVDRCFEAVGVDPGTGIRADGRTPLADAVALRAVAPMRFADEEQQ